MPDQRRRISLRKTKKMLLELDAVKVNEPEKFFNKLEKALVNDDESDDEDLQGKKSTDARSKKKNFAQEDQEDAA